MLKLILTFTAAFSIMAAGAFAQGSPIDKGVIQLGGGITFSSASGDLYENSDGDGETIIMVTPNMGYFVMPNLEIGGQLLFGSDSQGDASNTIFGIGPAVAYYFDLDKTKTEVKGKIYPYLGAAFLYDMMTFNNGQPGAEDIKWRMTTFSLRGGAAFMLSGAVGVYGQLGYDMDSSKQTDPVESESVSGSVFGLEIGITSFIY